MLIFQNLKFPIHIAYICETSFALDISASEMPRTDTLPARQEVSRKLARVKVQACMLCEKLSVKVQQDFAWCWFSHLDFFLHFVDALLSLGAGVGECERMRRTVATIYVYSNISWRQHVLHAASWDHTLKCRWSAKLFGKCEISNEVALHNATVRMCVKKSVWLCVRAWRICSR